MSHSIHDALRAIPSVESLLGDPALAGQIARLPAMLATQLVRSVLEDVRSDVRLTGRRPERAHIVERVRRRFDLHLAGRPARVVNGTGIVLHTNLGRAVLGERVARRLADVSAGYSDLEHDLETGGRGKRENHARDLLVAATGAEAALVVNNCAAATLLLLDTFARGREVIVSRGELVEIGGAFRMPDVLERSGARMVEVGTTNKTRVEDYRDAITSDTAVLLKVHTSNFRVVGFTEEASTAELAQLAAEHPGVRVIWDLGSGAMGRTPSPIPADEPTVDDLLRAGADLVAVSGDKLLGGPQAGLILGRRQWVNETAKNPLYRALRPDKLTIAALTEVLAVHLEGRAHVDIPALRMMHASVDDLDGRARALAKRVVGAVADLADVDVVDGASEMGGGTLPAIDLPTRLVAVRPTVRLTGRPAHRVEERLRERDPAVLVRVHDGRLLIDPRTLLDGDDDILVAQLATALQSNSNARPGDRQGGTER